MESQRDDLLARRALDEGLITREVLDRSRQVQAATPGKLLGTVLVESGAISREQLAALVATVDQALGDELKQQHAAVKGRFFGALLVRKGYCRKDQLDRCLELQKTDRAGGTRKPLGHYLVEAGFVTKAQVQEVLGLQNKCVLVCGYCDAAYNVEGYSGGKRLICKRCLNTLRVPEADVSDRAVEATEIVFTHREGREVVEVATHGADQATVVFEARTDATPKAATTAPDSDQDDTTLIGVTLGGCTIEKKLGQGGMGAVYRARHTLLDKAVAVKVLPQGALSDPARISRFYQEATLASRLKHPNIVQTFNAGYEEGAHFFVMELIEGEDLGTRLRRRKSLPPAQALQVVGQVTCALAYAHERGLIHRDIKPENVMIDGSGLAKVMDFGLVKDLYAGEQDEHLTGKGQIVGSPHYMAPEVINEERLDGRCDLYSLGVTLYQLLMGTRPFDGEGPFAILMKHLNEQPEPILAHKPKMPRGVAHLAEELMAKKREDRPHDARAVLERIDELLEQAQRESWEGAQESVSVGPAPAMPRFDEDDPVVALVEAARALLEAGKLAEAMDQALEALGRSTRHPAVEQIVFEAQQALTRAAQIDDFKKRLRALLDAQRLDEAFALVREAIKVAPDENRFVEVHEEMKRLEKLKRKQHLIAAIDQAITDSDPEAIHRHAASLCRLFPGDPAVEKFERMRDKAGGMVDHARILLREARAARDAGKAALALRKYREAAKLAPRNEEVRRELDQLLGAPPPRPS